MVDSLTLFYFNLTLHYSAVFCSILTPLTDSHRFYTLLYSTWLCSTLTPLCSALLCAALPLFSCPTLFFFLSSIQLYSTLLLYSMLFPLYPALHHSSPCFLFRFPLLLYSIIANSIPFYSTLLYSALLYALLYSTLFYSTLIYSTLLYPTLLYSILLYPTLIPTPPAAPTATPTATPTLLLPYYILLPSPLLCSRLVYATLHCSQMDITRSKSWTHRIIDSVHF